MTVTILGPGAVGTLIGALLSRCGHTVCLAGRKKGKAPARVRVSMPGGWHVADGVQWATPAEAAALDPDLVLVTLGRHDLRALKKDAFRQLAAGGRAHTVFFNCDPAEPRRLGFAEETSSVGATLLAAVKQQEGDVELLTEKPVLVLDKRAASPGGPAAALDGLSRFTFRVLLADDVSPFLNALSVYQLLFLPASMCNTTISNFLSFPEGRELARKLLEEGLEAMECVGQTVARLPLLDPRELLARLEGKPQSFERARFSPDRSYPPVLCDLLNDTVSEARELNKRMVDIAGSAGVQLTWNWRVHQKLSRIATVGFYRDPVELMKTLA